MLQRTIGRFARCTVVLFCALTQAVASAAQQSDVDAGLLQIASDLVRGRTGANAMWLGEWFTGEFMLLAPDGKILAVWSGVPPADFADPLRIEPLDDARLAYLLPSGRPGMPQRFVFYPMGNRRIVAFPVLDSIYGIRDTRLATVTAIYHEAFHLYQFTTRWFHSTQGEASLPTPRDFVEREDFQDMASRERALLAEALQVSGGAALLTVLRSYVQLRASRLELLPPQFRTTEAENERTEASAHLIGYRAGLLAVEGSTERLTEMLRSDLLNTPRFDDPGSAQGSYRSWHIYATGAAIAVLLERMSIPWEEELERGNTFWGLLTAAVPPGSG